jgi:chemotaxis protein CheX
MCGGEIHHRVAVGKIVAEKLISLKEAPGFSNLAFFTCYPEEGNMADGFDIGHEIVKGVQDVFSTMLMVELECEDIVYNQKVQIESNLTSMIGLGGGLRGVLAIHCPASVAKAITGMFLDIEVVELDEDVKDAIGEIANMVAGNLKVAYATIAVGIELAIPTSIVGEAFNVCGSAKAQRIIIPMKMAGQRFWVELMYVVN